MPFWVLHRTIFCGLSSSLDIGLSESRRSSLDASTFLLPRQVRKLIQLFFDLTAFIKPYGWHNVKFWPNRFSGIVRRQVFSKRRGKWRRSYRSVCVVDIESISMYMLQIHFRLGVETIFMSLRRKWCMANKSFIKQFLFKTCSDMCNTSWYNKFARLIFCEPKLQNTRTQQNRNILRRNVVAGRCSCRNTQ